MIVNVVFIKDIYVSFLITFVFFLSCSKGRDFTSCSPASVRMGQISELPFVGIKLNQK